MIKNGVNIPEIEKKPGEIWLNIGCGIVLLKDFINVDKYVTADFIQKSLNGEFISNGVRLIAKVEPGAEFVEGDILNLPFPDNYADYLECIDVVEHLNYREVPKAFSELYRVMKPGGIIKLLTNDWDQVARLWVAMSEHPYDPESYVELTQLLYGNQNHSGEYHHAPFNAPYLEKCVTDAGWKNYNLVRYAFGSSTYPPFRSNKTMVKTDQPFFLRSDMLYVEAIK